MCRQKTIDKSSKIRKNTYYLGPLIFTFLFMLKYLLQENLDLSTCYRSSGINKHSIFTLVELTFNLSLFLLEEQSLSLNLSTTEHFDRPTKVKFHCTIFTLCDNTVTFKRGINCLKNCYQTLIDLELNFTADTEMFIDKFNPNQKGIFLDKHNVKVLSMFNIV